MLRRQVFAERGMQKAELTVAGVLFYQKSGTPLGQLYESLGLPSGLERTIYRYFGIDTQEPPDDAEQIVLPYGFSPNTLEVMRYCDQYFFPIFIERAVALSETTLTPSSSLSAIRMLTARS